MALRIGLQVFHYPLLLIESALVSFGDHRQLHMVKWCKIALAGKWVATSTPKYCCVKKWHFFVILQL
jgi:hypothetical protein